MKNTFFLICIGLLFSVSTQAQKKKSTTAKISVPEVVTASFDSQYAVNTDNKWSKNFSGNYVAAFTNAENNKQVVEFDTDGKQIKSVTTYDVTALPENITLALAPKYSTSTVLEVSKVQIVGLAPYYKVQIENENKAKRELLVSEEGLVSL